MTKAVPLAQAIHLSREALDAGLDHVLESPKDIGIVEMIVRRPETEKRDVLQQAQLDCREGLIGDNWLSRGSKATADGSAHPEMQLNIMNSRVANLVAQTKDRWPLAGDQIYIDLDLSKRNLPAGTRLKLGTAIVEVTAPPHTGCKKFVARFGLDAMTFVNGRDGKKHCLRGINARVIQGGIFATGDKVIVDRS